MNRGFFILLCLIGALSFHSTQAQVARQEGIVRKITHSASDPVVPIAGVQVVVDGVSSPKSDKQGNLTITIRRNEESSYYLDDIRLPAGEVPYLLAYPSREKKLFLSPNELYIALISPEEKATVSKKIYTDLWRQYRRQGNDLIALRNELEEVQMALDEGDARYREVTNRLDSVQALLNAYFDDGQKESFTQKLEEVAEELALTDYRSLDSIDARIYDLKRAGEWAGLSALLNEQMNGNAEAYLQEGLQNRKNAEAIAERAARDLALRFERVEEAIESFLMQHQNDSVSKYLKILTEADSTNWDYLTTAGLFESTYMANYDRAMQYHRAALNYARTDSLKATSYNNIGFVYSEQGDYSRALSCYEKALQIQLQIYGRQHPSVATIYNNMGGMYIDQGDYDQALACYKKALSIQLQVYGEQHAAVAMSYNNIGGVYDNLGNYSQSLSYYEKALSIQLQVYGEQHPDVATSYNNIGGIYDRQGDYGQALACYEKALSIQLQVYDGQHPDEVTSYNNIGGVYYSQGDYTQAMSYYEKALQILLQVYGEQHPDVAIIYNNIGGIYDRQGDYAQAITYYEKSLKTLIQIYGEQHPSVATSYNNIGSVYYNQKDYAQALAYCEKALPIQLQVYGEQHPAVATSYCNMGSICDSQGNYSQALVYYEKSLKIQLQVYGEYHPDVATNYIGKGAVYIKQGDYTQALECFEKSYQIYRKVFGETNPHTVSAQDAVKLLKSKMNGVE